MSGRAAVVKIAAIALIPTESTVITFGILAGEPSGDRLGAGLMRGIKAQQPNVEFVGIGGPQMIAEGLDTLVPMERLAVNGFIEPIKRLPDLIKILRLLLRTFSAQRPAAFIGVDFNVFNFLLEGMLKRRGIPTVHYVSPSVYAWRRGRIRRIARSTDLLLTLYPFEPAFYDQSGVVARYVGHPLADEISLTAGNRQAQLEARTELGVVGTGRCIAILPGSRMSEVKLLSARFLAACEIIHGRLPGTVFVVPCLRDSIEAWLHTEIDRHPDLNIVSYLGNARLALCACDAAIVKSGTSTLEAMLLRRPMVVSYAIGALSYQLVSRLVRTPFIALPNILAGRELVPELLQDAATPQALAENLLNVLDKAVREPEYLAAFAQLHEQLRCSADDRAAEAILAWQRDLLDSTDTEENTNANTKVS